MCCQLIVHLHVSLYAGLEAKYGELHLTGSTHEAQDPHEMHMHGEPESPAADRHEGHADMGASPQAPSQPDSQQDSRAPDKDAQSIAEEGSWAHEQAPTAGSIMSLQTAGSPSTPPRAGTAGSRATSPLSEALPSHDQDISGTASAENGADWKEVLEGCKARLNGMLHDCGMPLLPQQV